MLSISCRQNFWTKVTVFLVLLWFICHKASSGRILRRVIQRTSGASGIGHGKNGNSTQSCMIETPFRVAILSVTHAPGFCTTIKCKRHQNEWIIHGLWPDYGNASSPEFCCYQPFLNKTILEPIMGQLKKNWKNVVENRTEWNSWIHQWRKHGTCYGSKVRGQLNYFKTALNLFERVNIPRWMSSSNITYGGSQHVDKVADAIDNGFGKRVHLSCSKDSPRSSRPVLTEVHFCYESEKLTKIDCPHRRRHNCRTNTGHILLKSAS